MNLMIDFPPGIALARVWRGELPDAVCSGSVEAICSGSEAIPKFGETIIAAIEVSVPSGPMCPNGLVGGTFYPDETGHFRCLILPESTDAERITWSLRGKYEKIVRGASEPGYIKGICDGVLEAHAGAALGSGLLKINCLASGEYGSSQRTFRRITNALVVIMSSGATDIHDLRQLIGPRILNRWRIEGEA